MAQRVRQIIDTIDDLDPDQLATEKRLFGVGKQQYTLDLTDEHAERFDREFGFWISAANRVGAKRTRRGSLPLITPAPVRDEEWWHNPPGPISAVTKDLFTNARGYVRRWAKANGWPLGDRGVVPGEVYPLWFDKVWALLDSPSWDEVARLDAEAEAADSKRRTARRNSNQGGKK